MLLCQPVELSDTKYNRCSFEFNFGMIVSKDLINSDERQCCELVLRRMAFNLASIELDQELLSQGTHKQFLAQFIINLFNKLTTPFSDNFWSIAITDTRSFHYEHRLPNPEMPKVLDCHVPILEPLLPQTVAQLANENLIIAALMPHINGKRHLKAISKAANIDIDICKMTVQHLLFFKLVTLHDLF